MKEVQIALLGLGNVGRAFADYTRALAGSQFSKLIIRGVADSSGGLILGSDLDLDRVLAQKAQGRSVRDISPSDLIADTNQFIGRLSASGVSVLIESLPTNIKSGQPALDLITRALSLGLNVVTVDKGPLVHGFDQITEAAKLGGSRIEYSGTTGVTLPDELNGQRVFEISGVLNGTTNHILTAMLERRSGLEAALAQARADGIAEPDPSLDVEGWDTAAKILILAKSLMNAGTTLADVLRVGINEKTEPLIEAARATGQVVRLVGRARQSNSRVRVTVAPELVASDSHFFSVRGTSKLAVFRLERGEVVSTSRSGRDALSQTILEDVWKLLGR